MRIEALRFLLFLFIISTQLGYTQFRTAFKIQDPSIKVVLFEAQQVSQIRIETQKASVFHFKSASEGTYKTDLYFDHEIRNDSLIIRSVYPKHLEFGDNKMTSMQEFSVSVSFVMPQNIKLLIDSDLASVSGSGIFKHIQINTKSGNCQLNNFEGHANINTYNGNIFIQTKQAKVDAKSQTGEIKIDSALVENYDIDLRTVNGNIEVIQAQ